MPKLGQARLEAGQRLTALLHAGPSLAKSDSSGLVSIFTSPRLSECQQTVQKHEQTNRCSSH